MAGPPFTVTFEVGTDDIVDYLQLAQKRLNAVGMGAGSLALLYGFWIAVQGDPLLGAVMSLMGGLLLVGSATRYADRLRARTIGRRIVGTQVAFSIGEGGIESTSGTIRRNAAWSTVDNVLESDSMIVLRRGRLTVVWLPKRAMGSPEQRDAALEFIRSHVAAPAG
ncbi:MAG TPA: YcxB family protein [Candidatus Limnocylindria bacterium]|nr:YcxB family protein [Candidatus Limnocylindria bacterium]